MPSWSCICSESALVAMPWQPAACQPICSFGAPSQAATAPRYEYTVVSNIHEGGLPPLEAGAVIAEKIFEILKFRAAGNRLEALLETHRKG